MRTQLLAGYRGALRQLFPPKDFGLVNDAKKLFFGLNGPALRPSDTPAAGGGCVRLAITVCY